jgi:hypothetical protein
MTWHTSNCTLRETFTVYFSTLITASYYGTLIYKTVFILIFTRIMCENCSFMYKAEALKVLVSTLLNYCSDTVLGFILYLYTGEMYVWINKFVTVNLLPYFKNMKWVGN